MGLALAGVIGLILFMKWGGRKLFPSSQSGVSARLMQVVGRTPVSPRQQLLLIRVGRRLMVVGDSGGRLSSLGQIDEPDEVARLLGQAAVAPAGTATAFTFGSLLRRAVGRKPTEEQIIVSGVRDADPALVEELNAPDEQRSPRGEAPRTGRLAMIADEDAADDTARRDTAAQLDAESESAVEAARVDIQALRAKLREVTQRLTEPPTKSDNRLDAGPAPELA